MGKKFELAHPTPKTIVDGYELLGLTDLLGTRGAHTAFELNPMMDDEEMTVFCLPGDLSARDLEKLFRDAGLSAA